MFKVGCAVVLGAAAFVAGCSGAYDASENDSNDKSHLGGGTAGTDAGAKPGKDAGGSSAKGGSPPAPPSSKPSGKGNAACAVTGDATCDACLEASCCAEVETCMQNAECVALEQCADECKGDQTCVKGCVTDHPNGKDDLLAVGQCIDASCKTECP